MGLLKMGSSEMNVERRRMGSLEVRLSKIEVERRRRFAMKMGFQEMRLRRCGEEDGVQFEVSERKKRDGV